MSTTSTPKSLVICSLCGQMTLKVTPNSGLTKKQIVAFNSLLDDQEVYVDDSEINLLPKDYLNKFSEFEKKCQRIIFIFKWLKFNNKRNA